ncbi:adenylate/guanylate cyclase domain-containing protein [Puteibacter caeruleilacunae]|nr:adenylate/guanylate cyclase domain-containing protein [Puteibacter caeruleilacunae]
MIRLLPGLTNNNTIKILITNVEYFVTMITVWVIAFLFMLIFQMDASSKYAINHLSDCSSILWPGIMAGIIWGGIFKLVELFRPRIPLYSMSIVASILINIVSAYLIIYVMYQWEHLLPLGQFPHEDVDLKTFYNSYLFLAVLAYFFVVGTLIEVFMRVARKFGQGVLRKLLMGRYYKPKEEERIFLFMDLKSSTYYAEKLGHFRYSKLIQDCFRDLSYAVRKNNARIYQYVGDEVVLTWKVKQGVRRWQCIQLYFDFVDTLNKRQDYYQKHYGMVPIFKAGVHAGKVMVAEVGELKTEIAYHGDAINTAARIQCLCNPYNTRLLISGDLLEKLKSVDNNCTEFAFLERVLLTGKEVPTEIYKWNNFSRVDGERCHVPGSDRS